MLTETQGIIAEDKHYNSDDDSRPSACPICGYYNAGNECEICKDMIEEEG